jgi:hypothetical protein
MTRGLVRKNNLSDLTDPVLARINLGLRTDDYNRIRGLSASLGVSNLDIQKIANSSTNFQNQINSSTASLATITSYLYAEKHGVAPTVSPASGLTVELFDDTYAVYNIAGVRQYFNTLRSYNVEPTIDFTDTYHIGKGGNGTNYSIRAVGQIQASGNGSNTFAVLTDDGVRVWLNGIQVVDKWQTQGATWYAFTGSGLTAGQFYDIRIEHFQGVGAARLLLASGVGGNPVTTLRAAVGDALTGTWSNRGRINASGIIVSGVTLSGSADALFSRSSPLSSLQIETASGVVIPSGLTVNNLTSSGNIVIASGKVAASTIPVTIRGINYKVDLA